MKFDLSNKFDFCYYGQVNSLRLKLSVASKWASKHPWGVTFILLAMLQHTHNFNNNNSSSLKSNNNDAVALASGSLKIISIENRSKGYLCLILPFLFNDFPASRVQHSLLCTSPSKTATPNFKVAKSNRFSSTRNKAAQISIDERNSPQPSCSQPPTHACFLHL